MPEPLECDRSRYGWYFQLYEENEVEWGDGYDEDGNPILSLCVDRLQASLGDVVTVRLTNVSGREITTGVRDAYNLELYTEEGWQEIRWMDADIPGVRSEGVFRAPRETVEWNLDLTDGGLAEQHRYADDLVVCEGVQPGRYWFVSSMPTEFALAVAFDIVEP